MTLTKPLISVKSSAAQIIQHNHISTVSVLETFLCLFVIFIHISSDVIINGSQPGIFTGLIFLCGKAVSFVVPAFIFSSAVKLTMKYKDTPIDYWKFLKNRLKNIYVPYVIWVIVYYAYFVFLRHYFKFSFIEMFRYILIGDLAAHFYFIIVIMQFYLLMPVLLACCKKAAPAFGLATAFLITLAFRMFADNCLGPFVSAYRSSVFVFFLVFWVMGIYCALYYDRFVAFIKKSAVWWLIIFVAIAGPHLVLSYMQYRGMIVYWQAEVIHYIFCLTSTLGFYSFLTILTPFFEKYFNPFKLAGGISYYVYLSHVLFIFIIDQVIVDLDFSVLMRFGLRASSVYVMSFVLCYLYVISKKRIKSFVGTNWPNRSHQGRVV